MSDFYEAWMERLAGCNDEECPECGHSQPSFADACDECGWAGFADDPDDYYDRLHDDEGRW